MFNINVVQRLANISLTCLKLWPSNLSHETTPLWPGPGTAAVAYRNWDIGASISWQHITFVKGLAKPFGTVRLNLDPSPHVDDLGIPLAIALAIRYHISEWNWNEAAPYRQAPTSCMTQHQHQHKLDRHASALALSNELNVSIMLTMPIRDLLFISVSAFEFPRNSN